MWDVVLSILGVVLSVVGPLLANWLQDHFRAKKEARERLERIREDEERADRLRQDIKLEYRELASKLLTGDDKVERRFRELMNAQEVQPKKEEP